MLVSTTEEEDEEEEEEEEALHSDVEQTRHISDSEGHILVLAFG